jgi:hypothetical protein
MEKLLTKVFGDLKPCQMDFYSEVIGKVFQTSSQDYGQLTYFYVFTIELDEDESTELSFSADLWYKMTGILMNPCLDALRAEFKTEEDARFVKSQGDIWMKGLLK